MPWAQCLHKLHEMNIISVLSGTGALVNMRYTSISCLFQCRTCAPTMIYFFFTLFADIKKTTYFHKNTDFLRQKITLFSETHGSPFLP